MKTIRKLSSLLFSIFILLAQFAPAAGSAPFMARCIGVTDGDTIQVLHDGGAEKIRLTGIDAPDPGQDYADTSRRVLEGLILGKEVQVQVMAKDRSGCIIGMVSLASNNWNINKTLVRNGYAWQYSKYSIDPELAEYEALAKKEKKGLWGKESPIAPWIYRSYILTHSSLTTKTASIQSAPTTQSVTVYTTRSGKSYHRLNCKFAASKNPILLGEALEKGYNPCSICKPEGYVSPIKPPQYSEISEEERQSRLAALILAQKQYEAYQAALAAANAKREQASGRRSIGNGGYALGAQGSGGGIYVFTGGGHWIQEKSDSGEIITLEDGSIWRVSSLDTVDSGLWLPLDDIVVTESDDPLYPYKLINIDDHPSSVVEAKFLDD